MAETDLPQFWTDAYAEARDHWDLDGPTPVFIDLLARFPEYFPGERSTGSSVIIPCSGRGYDALLFARHGFSVTAVDIAKPPLDYLEREASAAGLNVSIVHGDMFRLPANHQGFYDYCLEYTCYCAVDPARRDELIQLYWNVLKPGGHFIGLMFPIDPRPGGPPFSIDAPDFEKRMSERFTLVRSEMPRTSVKPRSGKEVLSVWRKPAR